MEGLVFGIFPAWGGDPREARLLARNLLGLLPGARILLLHPAGESPAPIFNDLPIQPAAFDLPAHLRDFPLGQKVFAAARAEELTAGSTLVWLDPDALFLRPPDDFLLPPGCSLAACPVHLKNISTPAAEPPDAYWQRVFALAGEDPLAAFPLTTRVDGLPIRAHFNAGCLAVRAEAGHLAAWREAFLRAAADPALAVLSAENPLRRIFLHQAVLSAVILARLPRGEIHILPETVNYPAFLQARFGLTPPPGLVGLRYDRWQNLSSLPDGPWQPLLAQLSEVNTEEGEPHANP